MDNVSLGREYEFLAMKYLQDKGYTSVCASYRWRHKEIDLILLKEDELIFVEVKYRKIRPNFDPNDCISEKKRRNIRECAGMFFLKTPELMDKYCRFDVVLVMKNERGDQVIRHIENAFE